MSPIPTLFDKDADINVQLHMLSEHEVTLEVAQKIAQVAHSRGHVQKTRACHANVPNVRRDLRIEGGRLSVANLFFRQEDKVGEYVSEFADICANEPQRPCASSVVCIERAQRNLVRVLAVVTECAVVTGVCTAVNCTPSQLLPALFVDLGKLAAPVLEFADRAKREVGGGVDRLVCGLVA
ncbi:hypothetical protein T492DRAFT_1041284 [Pavlovales sp. CCMP2436]|nr:hypothetical protein T492DRAFT_1041284 [Pavlovales sp. CCMP2436]